LHDSEGSATEPTAPARAELLQRLQYFRLEPRVIVDLGCGAGAGATELRRRFPRAMVTAVDREYSMTRQVRREQRFWRRFECVCADASALPFTAQSVDLIFSNLMLPYCDDPAVPFGEVQRVLRPGGLLLFSTLGPATTQELRAGAFADMPQLGAALAHARLAEPVMDRELQLARGARVEPAQWEFIYGAAFAGRDESQHAHDDTAAETAVPVNSIRKRPRSPS
jgi:malonyl-CoA O-methyltransferase